MIKPQIVNSDNTAPFNMAMLFYMELHEIRRVKSRAMIENNFVVYKDCLQEIYIMISFKLNKKEKEPIEILFKQVNQMDNSIHNSRYGERHVQNRINKFKSILQQIDMKLLKYMDKYRMIFPSIKMGVGIDGLERQYKIRDGDQQ